MKIGDLVRSLHGNEEGIITKIIDEKTIEFEVEEGLSIPYSKKELIVINNENNEHINEELSPSNDTLTKQEITNSGIFLAFIAISETLCDFRIINNTDYQILITIHQKTSNSTKGLYSGSIASKNHQLISKWTLDEFDNWGKIITDVLYFQPNNTKIIPPLHSSITMQASTYHKAYKNVPLLQTRGHLYQLDQAKPITNLNIKTVSETFPLKITPPQKIVDLHIDKLPNAPLNATNDELLKYQISVFDKNLDAAIAVGMQEITFIHGVGNYTLKNKMHKKLSNNPQVAYYKDAQKSKFGYGATLVKF